MPGPNKANFYALLSEAVADLLEYGFDSQARLDGWLHRLEIAARQSLVPAETIQSALRDTLMRVYQRTVEGGRLRRLHPQLSEFTLARIKPKLRDELDRRILATANLIRLNRDAAVQDTIQRFAAWATSIPIGGSEAETRGEVGKQVRRGIAGLSFRERRVITDQGFKLVAAINDIVATDGGAIAAIWRHVREGGGYQARPEHEARDGHIFVLRDCWALKDGLIKLDGREYTDQVEQPGQLVFCRCVPGSTRIPFANVKTVYRRRYDGVLLEITTASGKALRLTPNHPVLSVGGWRAADALNIGDYLVETVDQVVNSPREKDENKSVPTISQIFDFLAPRGCQSRAQGSSHQFHGDGIPNRDVNVVSASRPLRIDAQSGRSQRGDEFWFTDANAAISALSVLCEHGLRLWSAASRLALAPAALLFSSLRFIVEAYTRGLRVTAHACPGFLQAIGYGASRNAMHHGENFWRRASVVCRDDCVHGKVDPLAKVECGLRLISDSDSGFSQATPDGRVGHLESLCKVHGIDPGRVLLGQIVDIKRTAFSGHVYNLETEDGWYSAGGIITHNCTYEYIYSLRDLPASMLTEKGREALAQARARLAG